MSNELDQQILNKIANGDSKSFESLLLKYQDLVYGYCLKMLKDKQKAEDCTQEAWMKIIRNAHQYKPTGSVKSWIMSIARNLVIDEFRSQKRWADLDDADWNSIEDTQEDMESLFVENQKNEKFKQAFSELPENQKVVLTMILVEELSQSEVAVKLNTTVGAVKAGLFRAREALKKKVREL
jgi:RNA polymerase sigma-70 factor (ECF subfamily)